MKQPINPLIALPFLLAALGRGATIQVGPARAFHHPCAPFNAGAVRDGDIVEIDSADSRGHAIRYDLTGEYGDVMQCIISQNNVTVRGAGARNPVLNATGPAPNGKGIFNVKGNNFTVEYLTFQGATHPWCGSSCTPIRMEGDSLTVRWCVFRHNNMGLLHTPAKQSHDALGSAGHGGTDLIEHSQFYDNGTGAGQEHNVYINAADKLVFRFNISSCPNAGHLLKSRANENQVLYNLFRDDETCPAPDGQSSALLDFPMGGRIYLMGNIIVGGARMHPGPGMISIGGEILKNARLDPSSKGIYFVNNTILNRNLNTLSPDTIFSFPGGPDLDAAGNPIPDSPWLPCRGDNRHDTVDGWTRVPYPSGTTWLTEPPVVMNNVIWRYPNLSAWNGGAPATGGFCQGFAIGEAGGVKLGPPVLGPDGRDSNWVNWQSDSGPGETAWKSAGFMKLATLQAATAWSYGDPVPAAVLAEADSPEIDLRLAPGSPLIDAGVVPALTPPTTVEDGLLNGRSLVPALAYRHPCGSAPRAINGIPDLGAYEYGVDVPVLFRSVPAARLPDAGGGRTR